MSDAYRNAAESHIAMEEEFAADFVPATNPGSRPHKTLLMFSLIAFGAIGGYVNANWDTYKLAFGFESEERDHGADTGYVHRDVPRQPPFFAPGPLPQPGHHHSEKFAAFRHYEQTHSEQAPCCSQMSKAIAKAMLEVSEGSIQGEEPACCPAGKNCCSEGANEVDTTQGNASEENVVLATEKAISAVPALQE